ncbi:ADP-ribosylglycohydrolase family protein [Robiginitalea sp. M366]|uniref:ADP-ribosylglycohydrolase family protein n=1 Tax=Robiginitalea aestuariiviva TaxID=3036903 RepID=UPI00240E0044|nr:ADP-ribosylglycohydrolase family protein [Robiginitalea aestuariiviva]MDG1573229.1 ADP-ribosylglycohydrolase family protein [Robiginitalea aestuariiviva]
MRMLLFSLVLLPVLAGCRDRHPNPTESTREITLIQARYKDGLEGFWLAQCIANWTGLVTEMDKIGNLGEIRTGAFYTRKDWGGPDQPSIFRPDSISPWSPTIDFVFRGPQEVWGADDDTDIEYMYQHLLFESGATRLTPEQIREGWLKHIRAEEENYLWVSNQQAFDLMQQGVLPPQTSEPASNPYYDMIDAQLTTELFGLFAPGRPDLALELAYLPIQTTAREEAAQIAEFYVILHALAPVADPAQDRKTQLLAMASQAREHLEDGTYPAAMYDYVYGLYRSGIPWEQTRDSIYQRYQVEQADGYDITSRNLYCNGCFAAGINFAASLVSYFYGEGNLQETLKIGVLCGWDSDNPTATWGGLLGFMMGKKAVEAAFGQTFSNRFNIHRTRQNFPENGIDTFDHMAEKGMGITQRVIEREMGGTADAEAGTWRIPFSATAQPEQD